MIPVSESVEAEVVRLGRRVDALERQRSSTEAASGDASVIELPWHLENLGTGIMKRWPVRRSSTLYEVVLDWEDRVSGTCTVQMRVEGVAVGGAISIGFDGVLPFRFNEPVTKLDGIQPEITAVGVGGQLSVHAYLR